MTGLLKCPSCQSQNIYKIGPIPVTDIFAGKVLAQPLPGGVLYRCNECYLEFRFPRLNKQELDKLYVKGEVNYWHSSPGERKDWAIATKWIETDCNSGDILDVGCFDGEFLSTLPSVLKRFGIEIQPEVALKAQEKGVQIIGHDFKALNKKNAVFNFVVAFDVIEHVIDPAELLRNVAQVTRDGGVIIISTGNTQALTWRLMGSRYWYSTIAEHISFISPQWCQTHAKNLGLNIESIQRFSHAKSDPLIVIKEMLINLTYRFMPNIFSRLRKRGFGMKNVSMYPELCDHSPSWMTAKDHFIVKFRKIA